MTVIPAYAKIVEAFDDLYAKSAPLNGREGGFRRNWRRAAAQVLLLELPDDEIRLKVFRTLDGVMDGLDATSAPAVGVSEEQHVAAFDAVDDAIQVASSALSGQRYDRPRWGV